MCAQSRKASIDREIERELARRLTRAKAENKPAEVEIGGNLYLLVPVDRVQATDDPARDYDPARMLAAIEKIEASGGGMQGLDIEAFMEEIMESRDQDTPGHSF